MSGEPSLTTHRLHNLQGPPGSIYKGVFCPEIWHVKTQNAAVNLRLPRQLEWLRRAALPLYLFLSCLLRNGSAGQVVHQQPGIISHIHVCLYENPTAPSAVEKYTRRRDDSTRHGTRLQSRSKSFSATPTSTQEDVAGVAAGAVFV